MDCNGQLVSSYLSIASQSDLENLKGWRFDWYLELAKGLGVYKLTVSGDDIIQGLIAAKSDLRNSAFYVDLIESNPDNVGLNGRYKLVGPILIAEICSLSMETGFDGYVYLEAKSQLIDYYEHAYGAERIGNSSMMYIGTVAAQSLIDRYLGG